MKTGKILFLQQLQQNQSLNRQMNNITDEIKKRLASQYSGRELNAVARLLAEDVLGLTMTDILLGRTDAITDDRKQELERVLSMMEKGEPVQYAIGFAFFCGLKFRVNHDTLIPRPETEELVNLILKENEIPELHCLDIGTGSGCIAISIADKRQSWIMEACDLSQGAVDTAKDNSLSNGTNVNIYQQDIFQADYPENSLDIIVSNPPYITPSEKEDMSEKVLDFEPHLALFVPQDDPLLFYRTIAGKGLKWLKEGGRLYFEINRAYAKEMTEMLAAMGYKDVMALKDYNGNYRFTKATK